MMIFFVSAAAAVPVQLGSMTESLLTLSLFWLKMALLSKDNQMEWQIFQPNANIFTKL